MKYTEFNRGIPAGNPIANALVVIAGALAIGVSIVLGFFAFVVLGSIVLVLGAIIGLRVWWFNRKLRKQVRTHQRPDQAPHGGVIEGEYHVVKGDEKP
jgi:predicted lipid-binding transport protein (Tim44 family)